jgi:hypothetical protein
MKKAELIAALAASPDEAEVLIEAWPNTGDPREDLRRLPVHGELYSIAATHVIAGDEQDHDPPFFILQPDLTRESPR